MNYQTRRTTNKLLERCEEGTLDPLTVLRAALDYMSEADVTDMAESEEFIETDEEEDEDDDDSDEEE